MKKITWWEYRFEDGYTCVVLGLSANELKHEILKHGKLVSKRSMKA